ncbi:MAG: ketoacyl-ACP synthase III [Candidatus Marinimicrobia bacterium]|jgi:3-oxoacyl-[acyl-carrier-protein] synthase-3|nr:ketoacyl-ACP synthase III [Candidatus Neomarinimicrobiota bacterium]MBT3576635.1 ketoacyl-ACP synthase III [Candidatus Neomarinimicrobiota bacterium]MBT3680273.1 ketoacyl-ACP synthase III [Candidatus Neomarinimicrobiota bacterium]MBT3950403.1 ketoacyl-ACP synthase III [Candidatus Neomarinimicrobiota bacterium]MBT4253660.1 ketoacyl-ACP synthase III [Candidatus Neomarinimicrobiota bacterium]
MKQLVREVKITGTGSYLPEKVITNKYLESTIDTNADWIYENLGIKERRIAADNQATSDLASNAALNAIENAGLVVSDIDLIIVATATPDRLAPSTAAIVQDKIKAYNAVAFDIAAVCSGFLYGMSVASQYIATSVYDNVLVIGADTFSRITDWSRRDAVFFGDGAGAAIFSHGDMDEGFLAFRLYTDGRGKWNYTIPAGGSEIPSTLESVNQGLHYFQMNGREVYNTGTKVLPIAINQVLADTGLTVDDIDYMIPHQPSIKILKKTAEIIKLPWEKVLTNMDKYANTSGGTIPILLDESNRSGKLHSGSTLLFAAVGSGWTYGASILRWS